MFYGDIVYDVYGVYNVFCYTQFDAGTLFVNMITFILYFVNDKCIKDKYIS